MLDKDAALRNPLSSDEQDTEGQMPKLRVEGATDDESAAVEAEPGSRLPLSSDEDDAQGQGGRVPFSLDDDIEGQGSRLAETGPGYAEGKDSPLGRPSKD